MTVQFLWGSYHLYFALSFQHWSQLWHCSPFQLIFLPLPSLLPVLLLPSSLPSGHICLCTLSLSSSPSFQKSLEISHLLFHLMLSKQLQFAVTGSNSVQSPDYNLLTSPKALGLLFDQKLREITSFSCAINWKPSHISRTPLWCSPTQQVRVSVWRSESCHGWPTKSIKLLHVFNWYSTTHFLLCIWVG